MLFVQHRWRRRHLNVRFPDVIEDDVTETLDYLTSSKMTSLKTLDYLTSSKMTSLKTLDYLMSSKMTSLKTLDYLTSSSMTSLKHCFYQHCRRRIYTNSDKNNNTKNASFVNVCLKCKPLRSRCLPIEFRSNYKGGVLVLLFLSLLV